METILLGTQDFDEIVDEGLHIVDKTLFIRDFMTYGSKVCTILRPRRFGKSTNLSMLKSFLSIGADPSKFAQFEIGKPEYWPFVEKHCGKYPVVHLDFKDIKGQTWGEMSTQIIQRLKRTLRHHNTELTQHDPCGLKVLNGSKNTDDFLTLLHDLTETLMGIYENKVIVLIDEYDAPLNEAYREGYYEKAAKFFGSFYSDGLKGNKYLKKACLMGIVEVRGIGFYSSFNNAKIYSVADKLFSSSFGFTEDEIRKFLREDNAEYESEVEEVLEWYNGYNIGNVAKVVNPWSFISWYETKEFEKYWVDTSFSDTIRTLFEQCIPTGDDKILKLLGGGKVSTPALSTAFDYSFEPFDVDSVIHLLILTGYLTYRIPEVSSDMQLSSCEDDEVDMEVFIPNKELRIHWKKEFIKLFNRTNYKAIRNDIYKAITANPFNIDTLENFLKKYFVTCFSYHDFTYENSYHVALMSFFRALFLGDQRFDISSNREGGHGRYDILIKIESIKRVLCFELKRADDEKKLQKEAEGAFDQIKQDEYTVEYSDYDCKLIGVAFFKKKMSKLVVGPPGEGRCND